MMDYSNPFQYDAANNLPKEMVFDVFIEDHNYSRFLQSKRNVFLLGDRGSGKTMMLLFNSMEIKQIQALHNKKKLLLDRIGIYIPCNTALTHKQDYLLLEKFQAAVVSEHFLVLAILYSIADTLSKIQNLLDGADDTALRTEFEFIFGEKLLESTPFFESIKLFADKQGILTQKQINNPGSNSFYENSLTFSSAVLPFLNCLKKVPKLNESHYILLIDDAHDLNDYQRASLNSWIAYRDHSLFSFKVAVAKVSDWNYLTASGGAILEGHDFIVLDMEGDFQGPHSDFGKLARQIIERRLNKFGITTTPENFFPTNPLFLKDLETCRLKVKSEAQKKYPNGTAKQINDHVYKFCRAEYFRSRSPKANRPPYSGLETIIDISTGVIRNLLEPCFWMYDDVYSGIHKLGSGSISEIPPPIQSKHLIKLSEKAWDRLRDGLDTYVLDCTKKQSLQIFNMFDNLAILFKNRLLHHDSEPRAIVFTISGWNDKVAKELKPLLEISRRAQYLYVRTGSAKDEGKLEPYYVPNRILWPARKLDPHGQFARVPIKAIDLLNAANGISFPFVVKETESSEIVQEEMPL